MLPLLVLIFAASAFSQTTAKILGTVSDQSGAAVVGAKVTVKNTNLAIERSTTTNTIGYYEVAALPPGATTIGDASGGEAKSDGLAPEIPTLEITRFPLPVLVMVIASGLLVVPWIWLPNASDVGFTPGSGLVPLPLRGTLLGLPVALSKMFNVAERAPLAAGLKVTPIWALVFGATVMGSAAEKAKSPGLVPDNVKLLMTRFALPVFCTVRVAAGLVAFTAWSPKLMLDGLTLAAGLGDTPVPDRVMKCGLVALLSLMIIVAERGPGPAGVKVTLMVAVPPFAFTLVDDAL